MEVSMLHLPRAVNFAPPWSRNVECGSRILPLVKARGKAFGELLRIQISQKEGNQAQEIQEAFSPEEQDPCPCGSEQEYNLCCGVFHRGEGIENDAATVMRARYSAYARGIVPYIVNTTHKKNPNFKGEIRLAADVKSTCQRLKFVRLKIFNVENTSEDEAFVSFKVTYSSGRGRSEVLLEKSRFSLEEGRWLYMEAIPLDKSSFS